MSVRSFWSAAAAAVALWLAPAAGPALAQVSAEGSMRGVVRDAQGGVLPGVTVTAKSPEASRGVMAVTDGEGAYRLQNLVPGDYTLEAELEGFSRIERTRLQIRAGLNIVVDLTLQVGSMGETIEVRGETPMLESERSSKTVNISGELQRRLPLSGRRDFSDFLEITPGVTARGFDQASGGQVYMLRGTDIENHVTQVDGADMGSFRQNWAGLYMGLSTDAVADVQVKTAGADASSPLGVGLITQVATPSGTDQGQGRGQLRLHGQELERQQLGPWREPGGERRLPARSVAGRSGIAGPGVVLRGLPLHAPQRRHLPRRHPARGARSAPARLHPVRELEPQQVPTTSRARRSSRRSTRSTASISTT